MDALARRGELNIAGTHLVGDPSGVQYNITAPGGGTNLELAALVNAGNWAALEQYKVDNVGVGRPGMPLVTPAQGQQERQLILESPDIVQKRVDDTSNRSAIEAAMKSGGYDTSKLDDWTDYASREGLEKALTEFQKANPGSGSAVTSISKDLGAASAKRILATTPEVGLPAVAAAIPSFNAANLYKPANFEPQQPFYPTQPQAGLRAAMQTPSLVDMPVARPTLTPQAAYLSQIPLVAEPVARPTLDAQTAYIDAPAQMRAGGVVGYQEVVS
jgi:hypothetical protein